MNSGSDLGFWAKIMIDPPSIYAQVNILGGHEKTLVTTFSQTLSSSQSLRNHNPESNYILKMLEVRNLC